MSHDISISCSVETYENLCHLGRLWLAHESVTTYGLFSTVYKLPPCGPNHRNNVRIYYYYYLFSSSSSVQGYCVIQKSIIFLSTSVFSPLLTGNCCVAH